MQVLTLLPPILLSIAAIGSVALAWLAWRRWTVPGAPTFMLFALALAVWSGSYVGEIESTSLEMALFFARLEYIGIATIPLFWFLFAAYYTRQERWVSKRRVALLSIIPALTIIMAWTNSMHGMIWSDTQMIRLGDQQFIMVVSYGPWFFLHTAYSYLLLIFGTGLLLMAVMRVPRLWSRQSILLLVAILTPWIGNFLYLLRVPLIGPFDSTPFFFSVSAVIFAWGLIHLRLLNVVPIAYSTLVRSMSDGMIVLDATKHVVGMNPAAEQTLGWKLNRVYGHPVDSVLTSMPEIASEIRHLDPTIADKVLTTRHYDATITSLRNQQAGIDGYLIMLRDARLRLRSETTLHFLADVGALLGSSLQQDQTLNNIARLAVPTLANVCAIHLLTVNGALQRVLLFTEDPRLLPIVSKLNMEYPETVYAPHDYSHVIHTQKPQLLVSVLPTALQSIAHDERHLEYLQALGFHSSICVPLVYHQRVLGTLTLSTTHEQRMFTQDDLAIIEEFARRSALALEHAKLYQQAHRRSTELMTVERIAYAMNASLQLEAIFHTVVTQIKINFAYQKVSIYLLEGDTLQLKAALGYQNVQERMSLQHTVAGLVIRSGQPMFVRDANEYSAFVRIDSDIDQAIIVPLKTGENEVLGALRVESANPPGLTNDDYSLLLLLAEQISLAVTNARLLAISRESEERYRQAMEEAQAATRAKTEFLSNMSHEIRTPLTGVLGMTDLLLQTPLDPQQREYIDVVHSSGQSLLTIISDILDFSKIESGRLTIEQAPFSIVQCVEEAFDLVSLQALQKGLDLAYVIAPETPRFLSGDITRIRQILVNMLNNAVKFTRKGDILLVVRALPQPHRRYELQLEVRDTGIGISAAQQQYLFQSFTQADTSTTRRYGGSGLGLAISLRLCELMGGTMLLDSQEGEGATFTAKLIVSAVSTVADESNESAVAYPEQRVLVIVNGRQTRATLEQQLRAWQMTVSSVASGSEALALVQAGQTFDLVMIDLRTPDMTIEPFMTSLQALLPTIIPILLSPFGMEATRDVQLRTMFPYLLSIPLRYSALLSVFQQIALSDSSPRVQRDYREPALDVPESAPQHTILIVEDDTVTRQLELRMLQTLGYRAEAVENGQLGVQAVCEKYYQIVLLDVQMPEMDGHQVAQSIRKMGGSIQQPYIIAVTANATPGERERCLSSGMNDYLTKPIGINRLNQVLSYAISRIETAEVDVSHIESENGSIPSGGSLDAATWQLLETRLGPQMRAFKEEVVGNYIKEARELGSKIHHAVLQSDREMLRRAAHRLRSSSTMVGAERLSRLAGSFEAAADQETIDRWADILPAFDAELLATIAELDTKLRTV